MKIVTNNQHRPILFWWDLTEKERQKFDYLDSATATSQEFVRYKGELYDLGEFARATIPGWDGAQAHSYFNGMLIRYGKHYETVQIARYYQ